MYLNQGQAPSGLLQTGLEKKRSNGDCHSRSYVSTVEDGRPDGKTVTFEHSKSTILESTSLKKS